MNKRLLIPVLISVLSLTAACRKGNGDSPQPDDGRLKFTRIIEATRIVDESSFKSDLVYIRLATEDYTAGTGKGSIMHIWCYTDHYGSPSLDAGPYTPDIMQGRSPKTFIPGNEEPDISGSYIVTYNHLGVANVIMLDGGSFTVGRQAGSRYQITFDLANQAKNYELKARFDGTISITDDGEFDPHLPLPEAEATYLGTSVYPTGASVWSINLSSPENDITKGLVIETCMPAAFDYRGFSLETGSYTVSSAHQPGSIVAGTAPVPNDGTRPSGSYYYTTDNTAPGTTTYRLITGGGMTITRLGAEYHISTDLTVEGSPGVSPEELLLKFEGYPDFTDRSGSTPPFVPSQPEYGDVLQTGRLDVNRLDVVSDAVVYPAWATQDADSHRWVLNLRSSDLYDQVLLEFYTDKDNAIYELPPGQFPIAWQQRQAAPETSEPGYFISNGSEYAGCWYLAYEWPAGYIKEIPVVNGGGYINIEKFGRNDFLVSFQLYDYHANRITGKYRGPVSVRDASGDNNDPDGIRPKRRLYKALTSSEPMPTQ